MTTKAERNAEIVALAEEGETPESIAAAYGLRPTTIRGIVTDAQRVRWYRQRRELSKRESFVGRVRRLVPTWRSLDDFGRSLREDQWDAPRGHVAQLHWDANGILASWLDGRANETMTVIRLRKLVGVTDATA